MRCIQFSIITLSALVMQSCFIGPNDDSEKIVGDYYVSGDSGFKDVHLGFEDKEWGGIGLIEEPIIAIGHNDQYIIVKREKDKLEYFIAKITNSGIHSEAENNISGPMTENEFDKAIDQLNLQSINWTKKFEK